MPLISILVPNYNHARFLPQRLDSILQQTFRDFELIALDDSSVDNSREVLAEYAKNTPMRLVLNEKNSGSPFVQWRRGAELATGKYLWIAESDDYADPRLLQTLLSRLEDQPTVGLAYCQSFGVDNQNQVWGTWDYWTQDLEPNRWKHDYTNCGSDEVSCYLAQRNTIPNASAVLIRRDLLMEASQGAETMRLSGDWWTWSRALLRSDVAFVAEPLNYFRSHVKSLRDTTKLPTVCAEEFAVLAQICFHAPVSTVIRQQIFHEAFYKLRRCFYLSPELWPDRRWLLRVHADARQVRRSATWKIGWFIVKQSLKRVRFVAAVVRAFKSFISRGRSASA